jgi:glycosyltransferase involved in cell wall biosynthesis
MRNSPPDITLISTADWTNPYWTNKQHMAVQFAKRGHKVLFVESEGLRAPTATPKDLRRIWARVKRGLRPPRQVQERIFVWSPLLVPFHRYRWVRMLNRLLLRVGIAFWYRVIRLKPQILWTYSPLTAELYDLPAYALVVYHAVDDMKKQPGMPSKAIANGELQLAKKADLIFTTAPRLQAFYKNFNPSTFFYPNVADFDHFNSALDPDTHVPDDINALARPIIGFVGAISSYKLDFGLIATLARCHPNWSFVLIGEVGEGDPLTDASLLDHLPNVHILGGRPYASLPGYLKAVDVAILPSLINDYTRSMFPMKFFEYLASGKPVVSTDIPALSAYGHVAALCSDSTDFTKAIRVALDGKAPALELRLAAAREHTYDIRTSRMWERIGEALRNPRNSSRSHHLGVSDVS